MEGGYRLGRPNAQAWMTPWGTGLADGFGQVDRSKPSLGMEMLHFTGNLLFLAGIVGVRPRQGRTWFCARPRSVPVG